MIGNRAAHQESQAKFQDLVETIRDWVWEVDAEGVYTYASAWVRDLLGYESEEILGRTCFDLMPPAEARRVARLYRSLVASRLPIVALENINVHKDGRLVVLETSGTPILNANGTLRGYQGVDRDITERKKAEEAVKVSLAEKEFLLRELAHRTKNNMQVIASLMNLQAATFSDEKLKSAFADTRDRIRAMALIHEKLYRSDNLSSLNMKEYIEDLIGIILRAHRGAVHRVKAITDLDDVSISIDAALPLGLIINELVSNSLEHAFSEEETGAIFLSFKANGGRAELIYRDDGRGMPREFDLSQTSSLGLKLVHNLAVLQLRGTMDIRHGSGVEFVFTFNDLARMRSA